MKSSGRLTKYLISNAKNYFAEAEEFVHLTDKFLVPSWNIWFEMILSPLLMIVMCIATRSPPDILSAVSVYKTFQIWTEWFHYKAVKSKFMEWKQIVDATGGPFISTNDNRYMAYVYADGMQRLHNTAFSRKSLRPSRPTSLP
jgi:hypothetical protein